MRTRFNALQFLGDLLFICTGAAIAAAITLITAWVVGGGNSMTFTGIITAFFGSLIILMFMAMPVVGVVLLSGRALKAFLYSIDPAGVAMLLILGVIGAGTAALIALLFGLTGNTEFGRYAMLAAAVGGGVAGILAFRRL